MTSSNFEFRPLSSSYNGNDEEASHQEPIELAEKSVPQPETKFVSWREKVPSAPDEKTAIMHYLEEFSHRRPSEKVELLTMMAKKMAALGNLEKGLDFAKQAETMEIANNAHRDSQNLKEAIIGLMSKLRN